MVDKQRIEAAHAPAAIGPYSQAIRAGGLVFTSGQIPLDPATGELVGGGIGEQTRRVMQNLEAVLVAAGVGFRDVVKVQIFLADMGDFAAVNAEYGRWFDGMVQPARSTVQVARLPRDARVEIDMVAVA